MAAAENLIHLYHYVEKEIKLAEYDNVQTDSLIAPSR